MLVTPSAQVYRILADMAASRSYVPYTNGEQDVVESVFAAHRPMPPLPAHSHAKIRLQDAEGGWWRECAAHEGMAMRRKAMRRVALRPSERGRGLD